MRKPIVRAVAVGLLFVFGYFALQIIWGMYLTLHYVPDMIESSEPVHVLQQDVAFGFVFNPLGAIVEVLGLLTFGMILYYGWRFWKMHKRI